STLAIDTVCPCKTYLIFNAYRLLVSMTEDLVASCAEVCANSPDKQARLGSIVWLGETDYPQRWTGPTLPRKYQANEADMLRAMTSDPDTDVRTAALSKLNTHIRTTISEDSDSYIIWKGTLGEEITAIGAGCDKSHLVIGVTAPTPTKRGFALLSFNLDSKKADWVFSSSGAVNCTPQTTEDSIFFTSYDGTVYCADSTTGKAIWRRQVEGSQGWRAQNRILLVEHMVVVAAARCLWALDQATGDVLWNMEMNPKGKDQPSLSDCVAYASGYLFAPLCGDRVVKISSFGQVVAERDLGGATVHQLVSGSDRVYTITSIEYSATLSALSASDLTPLWKTEVAQAISVCETRGITDTIIVAVSDHTIALDAATGKPLWRVKEFGQFSNIMGTVDDCLIIEDPFFRLQIRHVDNGEIRLVYPAALYATSSVYTQGNIVAAGDSYGTLWLLRVPEGL
ncbi:MAG: hypothetical protein QG656_682, partial [Candidatus Hydrogenedentes bacterium]|nr:hypothetical protein [Candidatus Hydrogenedentota bacterium]